MGTNLNLGALRITAAPKAAGAAPVEFVDLSKTAAVAKIVRQGFDVPAVTVDPRKVDQFIGGLAITPPKDVPRVVSQSVAQGAKVPRGTVVDLVLAPRVRIPFDIFPVLHADLAAKKLEEVSPLFDDQEAKKTLLSYAASGAVPTAEKAHLTDALKAVGVTVDDTDQNKTFDKAFQSMRSALAFQ